MRGRLEVVVLGNVRDANYQHTHAAAGAVDDAWWNVNQRSSGNGVFDAIEDDGSAALQHIVELRGSFVVMELGSVDVHGVSPGGRTKARIFATDEPIAPTASTSFSRSMSLVAYQDGASGLD